MRSTTDLVPELNPVLWRVARGQGLASGDAADVVQTTWLELLRHPHDAATPRAATAWLITATRREAWHRRERARRHLPDGESAQLDVADPGPPPDHRPPAGDRDQALWRHFNRLPQRGRDLLGVVAQSPGLDRDLISGTFGLSRDGCLARLREMLLADPAWGAPVTGDLDREILERVARFDPPPSGLDDQVLFALSPGALGAEVARLVPGAGSRAVVFDADSRTVTITVAERAGGLVRVDGRLSPGAAEVELRLPGPAPARVVTAGETGRFVFDEVPHGLAQILVRPASGGPPVVTPTLVV
ncbi:RNA polymerase sigma factor [Actinoplanes sp. NPDC000266]